MVQFIRILSSARKALKEHSTITHSEPARLASGPEDYACFKIAKGHIEQWEDGIRLNPAEPNIEWWYFDSLLDDGAKLMITI